MHRAPFSGAAAEHYTCILAITVVHYTPVSQPGTDKPADLLPHRTKPCMLCMLQLHWCTELSPCMALHGLALSNALLPFCVHSCMLVEVNGTLRDPKYESCMQDFLSIDPQSATYRDVDAVLLDPSCSGSGTASTRLDYLLQVQGPVPSTTPQGGDHDTVASGRSCTAGVAAGRQKIEGADSAGATKTASAPSVPEAEHKRVQGLVSFQTRALRHALAFPSAVRVVYSTCSVYVEENEDVVAAVLPAAEAAGFSLMHALPQWHRRGAAGSNQWADKVVRVDPCLDGMDGFFVAVFERL